MSTQFYMQDSRSTVDGKMLFWRIDSKGYTRFPSEAEVFSLDDAQSQHNCRETDIPWPKDYIDGKAKPDIDVQYVKGGVALKYSGIVIKKRKKPRHQSYSCHACGRFITVADHYTHCSHCKSENRP